MAEITINLHDQPCGNCTVCIGRTIGAKHEQKRIIESIEFYMSHCENGNECKTCIGLLIALKVAKGEI